MSVASVFDVESRSRVGKFITMKETIAKASVPLVEYVMMQEFGLIGCAL